MTDIVIIPKEQVIAEWVAALRDPEATQTKQILRDDDGRCCLGVLCDVFLKHNPTAGWWTDDGYVVIETNDDRQRRNDYLPLLVQEWAGLASPQGAFDRTLDAESPYSELAEMNDDGDYTFEQIAEVIEAQPAGLFGPVKY